MWAMGLLKALWRCLLPDRLIFADVVFSWYPKELFPMIIRTNLGRLYTYKKFISKLLLPAHCCKPPV